MRGKEDSEPSGQAVAEFKERREGSHGAGGNLEVQVHIRVTPTRPAMGSCRREFFPCWELPPVGIRGTDGCWWVRQMEGLGVQQEGSLSPFTLGG